ncbi:hypothetical protein [Mycolicibacterium sp.]|uniref:hypothetical protein n=1 Tax=Mycolicibacterium sp. TaxID=2320850 RepID=UPI0037CC6ACA
MPMLIRAGQPPIIDDTLLADHGYAEDRTDDDRLQLMLAGGGATVHLLFDPKSSTAELVGIGFGETVRRADDPQKSLATFATASPRDQ